MGPRHEALDRLARGANCPQCGATPDETCRTPRGVATLPHLKRIDRACRLWTAHPDVISRTTDRSE